MSSHDNMETGATPHPGFTVVNEFGAMVELLSIWRDRRVVVSFNRHMGCRFCKEQAAILENIRTSLLKRDVQAIIITIGRYQDIPRFRDETKFKGEIYVDTALDHPVAFELMRLANGAQCLFNMVYISVTYKCYLTWLSLLYIFLFFTGG